MPKWTNKGHEFDELGNYFKENKNILILGYDDNKNNEIKKKLDFLADKVKITSKKVNTILYYLIKHFGTEFLPKNTIIIVEQDSHKILRRLLSHKSVQQNKNVFMQNDFFEKYLSIFAVYAADKVYFKDNSFLCTSICNLNCEFCLNFTPYDKNKQHFDINRLKNDVDTFFNCVDMVGLFHISGGEPFLYPDLIELIEYIYKNYKKKIIQIGIATNGTTIPSDELCKTLKQCEVRTEIDDYTIAISRLKPSFDAVKAKMENFGITPVVHVTEKFVEMFPPRTMWGELGDEVLQQHYCECGADFRELIDGKLSNCNYSSFATRAKMIEYNNDDYYDLKNHSKDKNKELVEFRLGYCNRGYSELCKYCEGLPRINKYTSPGGGQAKGQFDFNEKLKSKLVK